MNANDVNQHIQELESLKKQTLRFRLITLVALIAIVVAGISAIFRSAYSLAVAGPEQKEFLGQLNVRVQRDVIPVVQKVATRSLERLKPAVDAEIKRLNERAPEVADAAVDQLGIMAGELTTHTEKILDQSVGSVLKKREDKLRKLHPGVYDQKVGPLLDNMKLEFEDQLAKSGEKVFNGHLNSIHSILANLEKIQKTEKVDVSKEADAWQVAFLFADVFVHEFKDLGESETTHAQETTQ